MRTQIARVIDLDDDSWRLPRVDPTGWLARGPVDDRRATELPPPGLAGHVRPRRPRRTEEARIARERDLARRRRRRQGRAWMVGRVGTDGTGVASVRRVVEPTEPIDPIEPIESDGYRIGRWGRLTLTVLALATLALIVVRLVAALSAGVAEPVDVTVRPGDSLWSIAAQAAPDRDPRAVIDEIRELNRVTGDVVRVGEVLRVPVSPDRGSAE